MPVFVLAVAGLAGCGDAGPELIPVTGLIYKDGEPVPEALVEFAPSEGRVAADRTDEAGAFELIYGAGKFGAPAGSYTVSITTPKPKDAPKEDATNDPPGRPGLSSSVSNAIDPTNHEYILRDKIILNEGEAPEPFEWDLNTIPLADG